MGQVYEEQGHEQVSCGNTGPEMHITTYLLRCIGYRTELFYVNRDILLVGWILYYTQEFCVLVVWW